MATLRSRLLIPPLMALAVGLSACADPPGMPKPLPTDHIEESSAMAMYRKYAPHLREIEGVFSTGLTSNNNPRQLVVVVKDDTAKKRVTSRFKDSLEGLPLVVKIAPSYAEGEGAIEAVPTQTEPDTWWGKLAEFFRTLPTWLLGRKE